MYIFLLAESRNFWTAPRIIEKSTSHKVEEALMLVEIQTPLTFNIIWLKAMGNFYIIRFCAKFLEENPVFFFLIQLSVDYLKRAVFYRWCYKGFVIWNGQRPMVPTPAAMNSIKNAQACRETKIVNIAVWSRKIWCELWAITCVHSHACNLK